MDVRESLIMKRYMDSRSASDEILIDDRPYGVTNKLRNRLRLRDIIVFIEIIVIFILFTRLFNRGIGFNNQFLNIGLFFIVSLILTYMTSRIIISKSLIKEEVTPINRMYR